MANIGVSSVKIIDNDGDSVSVNADGRLAVETEQDDPFGTFVSYAAIEVATSVEALNGSNHLNISDPDDAKEIFLQADDGNTSYIMIGSSTGTTVAHATASSRKGIKLNGGETLVLALKSFAAIFLDAETSGQILNVSYFK
tara:strand:+ start:657 stop:1079 length:423 start_codon:yes stop_codon:yes gene_type:complete